MSFLRDSLDAQVHQVLVGRTLLVTHYAIYINDSRRSRTSNGFGAPALQTWITAAIDLHRDHTCRAEEVAEGWLEQGEHAAPTPVIVEISLSLDGQEHQVRKLFSPDKTLAAKPVDSDGAAAIRAAIRAATDQLATLWHAN